METPNKSQSAVEYLQTYSWAILLIVILGVSLWQFGVFDAGPKANVAEGFKKIKVLPASIKYISPENGTSIDIFDFTVMNTEGTYIHALDFTPSIDCRESGITDKPSDKACTGSSFKKNTLAPSETTSVGHICCDVKDPGDFFYVDVNISYTMRVGETNVEKTDGGVIKGHVESK